MYNDVWRRLMTNDYDDDNNYYDDDDDNNHHSKIEHR